VQNSVAPAAKTVAKTAEPGLPLCLRVRNQKTRRSLLSSWKPESVEAHQT
jgi:hypothetical protein